MVEYWYPYVGHPDGESDEAWFQVVDGKGYRTKSNPAGRSETPCFSILEGWAYPAISLPGTEPTFQVVGSFVYAPQGAAWFRVERAVHGPSKTVTTLRDPWS